MPAPAPALERLSRTQRPLALAAALLALAIAVCAGAAMLSSLYTSLAFDLLRTSSGRASGAEAAARAAALAPWRAEAHARLSEARLLQGDPAGAAAANLRRLHGAPADAHAWLQRASLLRQNARFDDALLGAYQMALQRAPQSPSLHYLIALHGLYDWDAGDKSLQAIWLDSTTRVMRRGHRHFLHQVVRRRRDTTFCSYAPAENPHAARWCGALDQYRAACSEARLSSAQLAWCAEMGLAPAYRHAR